MYACDELNKIEYFNGFCRHCISSPTGELLWDYFDYELEELFLYNNPAYLYDAFSIDILDLVYEEELNRLIIDFEITYNHREVITTINNEYVDNLYSDLYNYFYINDELIYQSYLTFNRYNQKYYDEVIIDTSSFESPINFNIYSFSLNGFFKQTNYLFDSDEFLNYEINLNDNVFEVSIPYKIINNEIKTENLTFYRLIPKKIVYPITLIPIVLINYENDYDDFNKVNFSPSSSLSVDLLGVEDQFELNLNTAKIGNNYWIVYIDDETYFDLDSRETKKGTNNFYYSEKGFILPFDYANNFGNLNFSLNFDSYFNIDFDIEIPIEIENSYSKGSKPKYEFVSESNDKQFEILLQDEIKFYLYEFE